MNARSTKVSPNPQDAGKHLDGACLPPSSVDGTPARKTSGLSDEEDPADGGPVSAEDRKRGAAPMTEEQFALYRERIESGFYLTPRIRQHIAERLSEDVFPGKGR